MKKFLITFCICIFFISDIFAQWSTAKKDDGRFTVYQYTFQSDDGMFTYSSNDACFDIVLTDKSAVYNELDIISFGFFMCTVDFYSINGRKSESFDIQLYCDKPGGQHIHSAINAEKPRKIIQYLSENDGYIKINIPSANGMIEFIVICRSDQK